MLETLKNAWKMADLRAKLLYTGMILLLFRIGAAIPVPFLKPDILKTYISGDNNWLGYIDLLSGGAFSNSTLFALGISPYITASIVIQLLAVAIPALEQLAKEGEEGRKILNKYTRYCTVALGLLQSVAYYFLMRNYGALTYTEGPAMYFSAVVIITSFLAGSMLVMWMGEQIDNKGIGNGISMILFAGIVSRASSMVNTVITELYLAINGIMKYWFIVPFTLVLFLAAIVFIVIMTNAERRIPVQYAQRVVGRKMYGGQSTHIPIKVNMSGVLPVIFASSILSIPSTIAGFMNVDPDGIMGKILSVIRYDHWVYAVLYFFLIMAFNYFYISIQYNPMEIANNLRKNNGTIPGIRPGKPTAEFIARVVSKVTVVGGIFLAIIAIGPILLSQLMGINISLGGTSIIIVVGVALDTVRQLESQMMMRHYKGFLE
ncbi:preprotein translocase subunit SecY [Hydrogenoanaerobacterium saccharovorans]|uniref:Protein translocase subunit SecY n=1 Tax=Hydrogenoanaerobacterium saccharovorans TaxID=474960 RepID=A0ABS2GN84_9FIRM|nr:preprotein translocase subunit SecY [Hydrogenoanaerobacterium saccharovorans]MBS5633609.1 preprotein translocase subunit SecY [Clostridiales bacterium]HIY81051.1 preprotein translocase subunit SecY [Bacillota bacterium]